MVTLVTSNRFNSRISALPFLRNSRRETKSISLKAQIRMAAISWCHMYISHEPTRPPPLSFRAQIILSLRGRSSCIPGCAPVLHLGKIGLKRETNLLRFLRRFAVPLRHHPPLFYNLGIHNNCEGREPASYRPRLSFFADGE